ncbi:MAG: ferrous iron transporter B, partial [Myxococcota bacterium]
QDPADMGSPAARKAAAQAVIEARYAEVDAILERVSGLGDREKAPAMERSERIDKVITHPVWGTVIFLAVMGLVFQLIFAWADPLVGLIEGGVGWLQGAAQALPEGTLRDLLTEGVIAGVGNVVVFLPQIVILFLCIGLLEDLGYMARGAFIVDRVMSRVGLSGNSFVPLLSGYACAVPAIMTTRTIASFKDRVVTILMIPFTSCSARLPIYALLIAALFDADEKVLGPLSRGGLILLGTYLLATFSALGMGFLYKRTILKSPTPPLVLELPPYRLPRMSSVLAQTWDRVKAFLRDAGTIILAATIVLWGALTFPRVDEAELEAGETAIEYTVGGKMGKAMEPALEPMGQDWRVGVGIIGSFAAREVFVSTLGIVYGIEGADEDDAPLREKMQNAKDPETGEPRYTKASGWALMIFFVYAAQCMSTLAVVKRETKSWKWPAFMFVTMSIIAYLAAVLVYQLATAFGS